MSFINSILMFCLIHMNLYLSFKSLAAFFFLLAVSNRCAEKLHYKKRKEKEELDRKQKKEYKRKRCQLDSRILFAYEFVIY